MITPVAASKIFSILGNNDSLIPMAIKDTSNSIGLTIGSYITGQGAESQDRFIDEFGTQAIWLLGIPTYKKILDMTLFKSLGFDAGVDVRILKDKEVFKLAKKYAEKQDAIYKNNVDIPKISKSLNAVSSQQRVFKGLTFSKFVISTLMTILTYGGLTTFRQKYREEKIKREFLEKLEKENESKSKTEKITSFKNKPSFTGKIEDFMFSPVKNLMIVDGSITGERLIKAKNKQEFMGYVIKEGSFWFFMYFAGAQIKKFMEKYSLNKHNLPIDMDPRAIESEELKDALLNNKIMRNLYEFPVGNKPSNADIYKFVNDNQDNLIVKMAKKSDIVKTIKINKGLFKKSLDTGLIDNRKFIDPDEIIGLKNKLKMFYDKGQFYIEKESRKLNKNVDKMTDNEKSKILNKYLYEVKKANRWSTVKNIGACIGFLGVIMPLMLIAWRFMDKENKEYQVRTDIENKLKKEMKIA